MTEAVELAVPGLAAEATILVDAHGIPHIRAASRHDLFFVQGWNAARDRLFQLDLWRKRGLGLLSVDFGPGYLMQDRAARLFLYRGDMAAEWAAYGPQDTRAIVERFTAGLNAYVDLGREHPDWMPPEFGELGTVPARWAPEDVVRIRSHGLVRNLLSEVARARVAAAGGLSFDHLRKLLEPDHASGIPAGLDPASVPAAVAAVFQLATAPVTFEAERLAATLDDAWRWSRVDAAGRIFAAGAEGSNNWAVSGRRTATGRPIMASDPHRTHQLPSLRYIAHLTAPDLDLIGAGEPALPGLSLCHNGHAAFSLTIFPADQEDLYVYETSPDGAAYRYGQGYEPFREVIEKVPVKGAPDQEQVLRFTRHGPVVHQDEARGLAFAVRSVWLEPGSAPYLGSLAYLDARTPEAFGQALRSWSAPSVNQLYADAGGRIAWFAAGKVPRRPNWDGLMPVPGDGRYEWDGFWQGLDLPRRIDPPEGFVFSANEMNIPADDPAREHKLGFEWLEAARATRIRDLLSNDAAHDLRTAMALQTDTLSLPAARVCAVLAACARTGWPDAACRGADLLAAWDNRLSAESGAAALFETWWMRHLRPALLARAVEAPGLRALLAPLDNESMLRLLEQGRADEAERASLMGATLAAAFAACAQAMGADCKGWAWGRLHQAHFLHPAHGTPVGQGRDVGPLPLGGSGSTVMNAHYDPQSLTVTVGASFRMVLDVGDWDRSMAINAPGQSGVPGARHYDDLAAPWAAGQYVPLPYSAAAVEAAARMRFVLRPV